MTVTALVPLKDLVMAKTRLSGLLSSSERRGLALAMAQDVLSVLAGHECIDQTILVSDDPGAELLATGYQMQAWSETSLDARGLNAVLQAACRRVAEQGSGVVLILHADLPLLGGQDITRIVQEQQRTGGLVIGTDHAQSGTNILAFNALEAPQFRFGLDSRALHEADASEHNTAVTVISSAGISTDVDEAGDLALFLQYDAVAANGKTAQLLRGSSLMKRLSATLSETLEVTSSGGAVAGDNTASGAVADCKDTVVCSIHSNASGRQ